MNIPITNNVGLILLALFTAYIFYSNRALFTQLQAPQKKLALVLLLSAQVAIIVGSRFVTPDIITAVMSRDSAMFGALDIGLFLAILFVTLRVGDILKLKLLQ